MQNFRKILFFCGVAFGSIFFVWPVFAFSISPIGGSISINPGDSQIVTIQIKNDNTTDEPFDISIVGVRQDPQGRPIFGQGFDEAVGWVTANSSSVMVPVGQTRTIHFSVAVPRGVYPGMHLVGLSFTLASAAASNIAVKASAVALVSINVAGTVHESLEIRNWSVPWFSWMSPWLGEGLFKNSGTVSLPLSAKVVVKNWWGGESLSQNFSLGNNLIVQSERDITLPITVPTLWAPGPYHAFIMVTYGLSHSVVTAEGTVWYVPWWSLAVLGLIIVLIILKRRERRD